MEHAEGSVVIEAPLEDVMEVIEDYESYPEWAEVQTVDIRQRGDGGRAYEVAFEVDVPVLGKAAYTLAYVYAPGDAGRLVDHEGGAGPIRDIRGEYLLNELADDTTKVTYRLAVELGVLVPGFLRTAGSQARDRERAGEASSDASRWGRRPPAGRPSCRRRPSPLS